MNEQFNQLMVQEQEQTGQLTAAQIIFVETHKQIMSYGNLAARSVVEMAHKLKEMRDGELYKAAGFESFGEYTEQAAGIKERQAYNYITVVESYDEKYLAEHAKLGVTKLLALSTLSEEKREQIAETVDLKKASTREVKDAVKAAQKERDEAQHQLEVMQQERDELSVELDTARQEKDDAETAREEIQTAYDKQKEKILASQTKIDELTAKQAELEKQLAAAKAAKTKTKTEVKTVPDETAQKERDEAREQLKAAQAEREELDRKLREITVQLEEAKAQKKAIAQDDIITFKIKFDDIQQRASELIAAIGAMDEDFAFKCKNAFAAVIENWKGALGL